LLASSAAVSPAGPHPTITKSYASLALVPHRTFGSVSGSGVRDSSLSRRSPLVSGSHEASKPYSSGRVSLALGRRVARGVADAPRRVAPGATSRARVPASPRARIARVTRAAGARRARIVDRVGVGKSRRERVASASDDARATPSGPAGHVRRWARAWRAREDARGRVENRGSG
jgi:hypothetical protein